MSNTSTLVVLYLESDNSTLVPWSLQSDLLIQYLASGRIFTADTYENLYGTLVAQGLACPAG